MRTLGSDDNKLRCVGTRAKAETKEALMIHILAGIDTMTYYWLDMKANAYMCRLKVNVSSETRRCTDAGYESWVEKSRLCTAIDHG